MKPAAPAVRVFVPLIDDRYDHAGFGPVEPLAEELPLPSELAERGVLVVLSGAERPLGFVSRVLGKLRRRSGVHRAVRGAALLARGYTEVSGGTFGEHTDAAWGFTAPRRRR